VRVFKFIVPFRNRKMTWRLTFELYGALRDTLCTSRPVSENKVNICGSNSFTSLYIDKPIVFIHYILSGTKLTSSCAVLVLCFVESSEFFLEAARVGIVGLLGGRVDPGKDGRDGK
jgi:hypothetical protein